MSKENVEIVQGGKAERVDNYVGWQEALEAAGLPEQDAHAG